MLSLSPRRTGGDGAAEPTKLNGLRLLASATTSFKRPRHLFGRNIKIISGVDKMLLGSQKSGWDIFKREGHYASFG
jgi:hypothetical protein